MKFKMMSLALMATLAATVGACASAEETTPAPEATEEAAPEATEEAAPEAAEEGAAPEAPAQ